MLFTKKIKLHILYPTFDFNILTSMNRMLNRIIFILVTIIAAASSHALDLNEALAKAYESNSRLNAAREELKVTDEKIMEALSEWLPHVDISASRKSARVSGFSDNSPQRTVSGVVKSLEVKQNLFNGGEDVSAIKSAKYAVASGRSKLVQQEQEVLSSVVEAYMRMLQWEESYKFSLDRERQAKQYLMGMKLRFTAGQNTKADIARSEAELATAIAGRANTYVNYKSSRSAFLHVVGLEPQNLSIPLDNVALPQTLDEATTIAMAKNPELNMAINHYGVSSSEVGRNLARLLPKLSLEYALTDNSDAQDFYGGELSSSAKHQSTVSLSLKIPLFDGGKSWSNLRKTKRIAKQSRYYLADSRHITTRNLITAWEQVNAAKAVFHARTEGFRANKISYDSVLAEEKAGLRDTIDVITTKAYYYQAHNDLLEARTAYFKALYALKSQLGECTAEGLGLKVTLFDPTKNYNAIKWQLISGYTGD